MCQVNDEQKPLLFENKHFIVINKPQKVHFDEIVTHCVTNEGGDAWQPVHRIDYETSGALLVSKRENVETYRRLFQTGEMQKIYIAGATHSLSEELLNIEIKGWITSRYRSSKKVGFVFDMGLGEKPPSKNKYHSVQEVKHVVKQLSPELETSAQEHLQFKGRLYEIELISGARHQIRAFFQAAGAPLFGDPIYNPHLGDSPRMELHAYSLKFIDPISQESFYIKTF